MEELHQREPKPVLKYLPRLIGLRGKAGSGKDTLADYLVSEYGYIKMSFASPLKRIVCILTGWSYEFVDGATPEYRKLRETLVHPVYKKTCRELLQFVGTELFRNQLHTDIWVECLRQDVEALFAQGTDPSRNNPNVDLGKDSYGDYVARVVVTDCRFPNEARALIDMGGMILHLERPGLDNGLRGGTATHASEKDFEVQGEVVVTNDGTLDDLYRAIDATFEALS